MGLFTLTCLEITSALVDKEHGKAQICAVKGLVKLTA